MTLSSPSLPKQILHASFISLRDWHNVSETHMIFKILYQMQVTPVIHIYSVSLVGNSCMDLPVAADVLDRGVERDELGLEELSLSKLVRSLF